MESTQLKQVVSSTTWTFTKKLRMIEVGRSVPDVAVSLGIGANVIYQWRKRSKKKEAPAGGQAVVVFDEEKAALQKRIRELKQERDF